MKSRDGKRRRINSEETVREEKVNEEKVMESQKKNEEKLQVREKVGKSRNIVFPVTCGPGGSKSRLAKAAGAERAGQKRDEKLHVVVVLITCGSPKEQNTATSNHFWKLRCRKSAWGCGAKHITKSKCTKHTNIGPLVEVEMSKKRCGAKHMWKSKCTKHLRSGPLLGVRMSFCVADRSIGKFDWID